MDLWHCTSVSEAELFPLPGTRPRCPPLRYLEWRTGMEHLVRMLPMMMASRSVQVPDSHRGMRMPAEGEE